jgi:hypothetical protein
MVRKRIKFSVLIIILVFFTQCKKGQISYKGVDLNDHSIYLFYRETNSKAGMISKSYNIHQSNYSHVGIGFLNGNQVVVYHILHDKANEQNFNHSELLKDTIEEFYNPKNDEVVGGEILLVNDMPPSEIYKIKKVICELESRNLHFDEKFTSELDNNFYCSELVYYILNSTNEKFYMEQTHKKLTGIDKILLKRDSISYYPADIFINNRWFKSLKKW